MGAAKVVLSLEEWDGMGCALSRRGVPAKNHYGRWSSMECFKEVLVVEVREDSRSGASRVSCTT